MIEYKEVSPLPQRCQECEAAQERWNNGTPEEKAEIEAEYYFDCGECDYAGERWILPREQEIELLIKLKKKAMERIAREIIALEEELKGLEK